ncbi:MAG: YraN family protein [Candidatus Taylorbacteria bacterium]|nr:YraN family protein [Candidatus Taylorbacteria bacterium]
MKNINEISKKEVGFLGENVTCAFLERRGYDIVARNYSKKCGELDIVAKKEGALHFVEVKSVSCSKLPENSEKSVMYASFTPEENVNAKKISRIRKTVQLFMNDSNLSLEESDWFFHVAAVYLKFPERVGRVFFMEHQVL